MIFRFTRFVRSIYQRNLPEIIIYSIVISIIMHIIVASILSIWNDNYKNIYESIFLLGDGKIILFNSVKFAWKLWLYGIHLIIAPMIFCLLFLLIIIINDILTGNKNKNFIRDLFFKIDGNLQYIQSILAESNPKQIYIKLKGENNTEIIGIILRLKAKERQLQIIDFSQTPEYILKMPAINEKPIEEFSNIAYINIDDILILRKFNHNQLEKFTINDILNAKITRKTK